MEIGHVILELKQIDENTFESIYHLGLMGFNFQRLYSTIEIKNGQIPNFGFYKIGEQAADDVDPYEFRVLNDKTNYLRLSSFNGNLTKELNTFYDSISSELISRPNLIIDLRNNSGGDEAAYYNLIPLLYTRPLKIDNVKVWVTPENIKRYEVNSSNTELINRMKNAAPYTFIPQVLDPATTWKMDTLTVNPKKVIILFNRKTASSAEGMITYAMQSEKVITSGENSGGFMGYGNVMEVPIPCGKFTLRSTTTMYENNSQYEFTGIRPMYRLPSDKDWIDEALKLMEK